jgi:hypothetical protein
VTWYMDTALRMRTGDLGDAVILHIRPRTDFAGAHSCFGALGLKIGGLLGDARTGWKGGLGAQCGGVVRR